MLSRAMEKAERLQKYVNMGSEGFKLLMASAQANRTKMTQTYSLPKQRWLQAVHRIILRTAVQRVRDRIEAFEDRARKKVNDALILAISVADARTESATNPLSPRLQPLTSRVGNATPALAAAQVGSSGAKSARDFSKSTRARRQTAETPHVKKDIGDHGGPVGSHANPLASLLGGAGASVSAAASAAAGALSSLTHAVEGALHKGKAADADTASNSQKSKSTRSRRRSTLESRVTPTATATDKSVKSERIASRKNSLKGQNPSAAVMAGLDDEAAAVALEEEVNFRLRRVTEMPVERGPGDEEDDVPPVPAQITPLEQETEATAVSFSDGVVVDSSSDPMEPAVVTPVQATDNIEANTIAPSVE